MTKIVPVLQGGLGNQLFIYSAARRLALQTGSELVLDNKSGFERDSRYKRTYALHHFLPHARVAVPHERIDSKVGTYKYFLRLRRFLTPNKLGRLLVEKGPEFDSSILSLKPEKDILYMEGYWQSANYFVDIESVIRSDLEQKPDLDSINKMHLESIKQKNSTAIHVRFFNDYADEYAEMKQYYMRAFQYIEMVRPDSCYYIFGEGAEIIKSLIDLPKERVKVISHNRGDSGAYLDFFLMRQCKNLIIAKSTFSWWAAWLSERKEKLVIAPKAIKTSGESIWAAKGMLPKEWIKL